MLDHHLLPEYRHHPILGDNTTWRTIYYQAGAGPAWTTRYSKELKSAQIETVADFARFIMLCNLAYVRKSTFGSIYRFHHPAPNGQVPSLKTNPFGGWGWQTALATLQNRGFDWATFLINDK